MSNTLPYTKIPYADRAWHVTTGCTPCSAGCDHCWAQAMLRRFPAMGGTKVKIWPERLSQPEHTRKPSVIFVAPMGDLFHEDVSEFFMRQVVAMAAYCRAHTFLFLTKRPLRFMRGVADHYRCPPRNIWLGCSVEDQATADERVPLLLESGWPNLWVSAEPLLEPVSLSPWLDRIGWVVTGCESGAGARPCVDRWLYKLMKQAQGAGIPHYEKQWRGTTGQLYKRDPRPQDLPFRLAKWGAE